jgi:hypothetical protein
MERDTANKHPGYQYVNPQKCQKLDDPKNPVEVKCYDNGLWQVCPNPRDKERSEALCTQYNRGVYISFLTCRMSEQQFGDRKNWNS